jgi:hypothetical protein
MAARMAPAILFASNDISEPSGKCLARADFRVTVIGRQKSQFPPSLQTPYSAARD